MKKIIMILTILLGLTGLAGCNNKTTQIKNMANAEAAIVSDGDRAVYDFAIEANRQFKLAYDFRYVSDYKTCLVVGYYIIWAEDDINNYIKCQADYRIFVVTDNGHIKSNRYALYSEVYYNSSNNYKLSFDKDLMFEYIGQEGIGNSMFWDSSWIDANLEDVVNEYSKFDTFSDYANTTSKKYQYCLQVAFVE